MNSCASIESSYPFIDSVKFATHHKLAKPPKVKRHWRREKQQILLSEKLTKANNSIFFKSIVLI